MIRILFMVLLSGLLNSCGVIQKSRYGNGLHIDLFSRSHNSFDSARLLELRSKYKKDFEERPSSVRDTLLPDCKPQFKETNASLNGSKITHEIQFTSINGDKEVSPEKNDSVFLLVDPIEFEPPLPYEDNKKNNKGDDEWEPTALAALIVFLVSITLLFLIPLLGLLGLIASMVLSSVALFSISQAKKEGVNLKGGFSSFMVLMLSTLFIILVAYFLFQFIVIVLVGF